MRKKILKIILLIILVVFILLFIHTIRNIIIIKDLTNKIEPYKNANNFYVKTISTEGNIMENWNKDERHLMKLINTSETGVRTMTKYSDGKKENTYFDVQTKEGINKVAILNSNGIPSFTQIHGWFEETDIKLFILSAMMSHIKSAEQDGKDCYEIKLFSTNILMPAEGDFIIYIDKQTGLTIKSKTEADTPIIMNYEYKFNVVTDDDLIEPDVSEYKIQENNS